MEKVKRKTEKDINLRFKKNKIYSQFSLLKMIIKLCKVNKKKINSHNNILGSNFTDISYFF